MNDYNKRSIYFITNFTTRESYLHLMVNTTGQENPNTYINTAECHEDNILFIIEDD